jgi:amino acid transporter
MEGTVDIRTFLKREHELCMGALAALFTSHCMIWLGGYFFVSDFVDAHRLLFVFSSGFHICSVVMAITYLSMAMRWRQANEYQKACDYSTCVVAVMTCLGITGVAFVIALPYNASEEPFRLCQLWVLQSVAAFLLAFIAACFAMSDYIIANFIQEKKEEEVVEGEEEKEKEE